MAKKEIKSVSIDDVLRRKRKIRFLAFLGLLIILLLGLFYIVVRTEVLKVTGVVVAGNRVIETDLIKQQVTVKYIFNSVPLNNLPVAIKNVKVSRNFFKRTINVLVIEREQYGQWCNADFDCFWFDKEGILFTEAPRASGSLVRVVISPYIIEKGDTILPDRFLGNFLSILNILDELNLSVTKIEIEDLSRQEMTVYASSYNIPIMFSLRDNPEFTYEALEKLKTDFNRLSYIDLRSSNRAFYRYK